MISEVIFISKKFLIMTAFLIPLLCMGSLLIGSSSISFKVLMDGLLFRDAKSANLVYELRMPRLLLTIMVGYSLSISGFLMQTVSKNKLVSPSMVGIIDGALMGVVLSQLWNLNFSFVTPIAAILGALITVGFVYCIAGAIPGGFVKTRFVLIGIIVSNVIGSLANLISIKLSFFQEANLFFLGTVSNAKWWDVNTVLISILITAIPLVYLLTQLNGFYLNEDMLHSLGKPVKLIKILSFTVASILSAVSISVVGKINFVGLIIPNIVYMFRITSPAKQLFLNTIISMYFMLISDILSKLIKYPYETQISFVISFIGIPFFFYIIKKQGDQNE